MAQTLGVSRSNLISRLGGQTPPRRRYHKAQDVEVLPLITKLVTARSTYGYRRITAVLNRPLRSQGHAPINHKRVYRIMQAHNLLLARKYSERPDHIRDIMLEAVERRFSAYRAPGVIEMPTDNGSPYIAKDTQIFARQIGLKPYFTPVRSPQSNGVSEVFVKTLKRDYVQITPLPDTQTVPGLIATWFEDYNENHPHSGLKMRAPRQFIADQTATA